MKRVVSLKLIYLKRSRLLIISFEVVLHFSSSPSRGTNNFKKTRRWLKWIHKTEVDFPSSLTDVYYIHNLTKTQETALSNKICHYWRVKMMRTTNVHLFLFIIFTFLYSVIRRRQSEGHRRWCIQTCRWLNRHFGKNSCLHSTWGVSFRDIRIQCRYLQLGDYAVGDVVWTTGHYQYQVHIFDRIFQSYCERRLSSRAWQQMPATSSLLARADDEVLGNRSN